MSKRTKITLYMDIYPGMDMKYVLASANPGTKTGGVTRYAITVSIPDIHNPDEVLPIHEIKEVDKEAA